MQTLSAHHNLVHLQPGAELQLQVPIQARRWLRAWPAFAKHQMGDAFFLPRADV